MGLRNTKIIEQVKGSFLTLCAQYEKMGELLQNSARVLVDQSLLRGPVGQALMTELAQYREMGDQMKQLGKGIDLLGGKSVLFKPEKAV